jgi:CBS domain-containing protein
MFDTKNIMTADVISVKKDTPIDDAVDLLVENNVTGLPVVDDDMNLVGVISEKDMLSLLSEPESSAGKVEDYMTKDVVSFEQDEDMIAICECLVNNNFRRVPIVDNGRLVGIVSRRDIIKYILEPIG